jgi:hypothetical protein
MDGRLSWGYNVSSHFAADLDLSDNRWDLNSRGLATLVAPGGHVGMWTFCIPAGGTHSAATQPGQCLRSPPESGVDYRNLTLTQSTTVITVICDPFFGCYPAALPVDQVVASLSTVKPAFNAA